MIEGYTSGAGKEVRDGLMATGDLGHFDHDGLLYVEGRLDDMIVSGGENVYPAEVEETIARLPAVVECAVVGVQDAQFGQALRAYVVTKRGTRLSEERVKDEVRRRLARYKVPRSVVFLPQLPRNATGKIVRRELANRS